MSGRSRKPACSANAASGLAPLVDWLGVYGIFWRERFTNLKSLLEEMDNDQPEPKCSGD